MSTERLTPTSYLVLGLLAREGPATPYRLEQLVATTVGNFWSFPHTLLYSEPPRLETLGLVTETRESEGRRRRIFAITPAGMDALAGWLTRPVQVPTELRDLGLLQLFFIDLASEEARLNLATKQLAMHAARLAAYVEDARIERGGRASRRGSPTVEHWRGATLPMGLLYERAAVAFWTEVAGAAAGGKAAEDPVVRRGGSAGQRGRAVT